MHNLGICLLPIWFSVVAALMLTTGNSLKTAITTNSSMQAVPISKQEKTYFKNNGDRQALSSDGKILAIYNRDEKIALLVEATTGVIKEKLKGHSENISALAFSPDEKTIVTMGSCPDCTARLWDADTGKRIAVLRTRKWRKGLLARLSDLFDPCKWDGCPEVIASFSPNSQMVITTTDNNDPVTKIWDATTGKLLASLSHKNSATQISIWEAVFSVDGTTIITFESLPNSKFQISRWNTKTGRLQNSVPATRNNIAIFQQDYKAYVR